MTADRFGPAPAGEYTALRSIRTDPAVPEVTGVPPGASPPPVDRSAEPGPRRHRSTWVPTLPPQHGAWAFLIVPVLAAFAIVGASPAGWLLLGAWLCAYPLGYYAGRALTARARRGTWTRLARREAARAVPWAVLTALLGVPLAVTRPWLLLAVIGLAALWGLGLVVADRTGERSMANDLLLVAQAAVAVPLTVAVVAGPGTVTGVAARDTATATALVAAYLVGSVLHVKALIREADRPAYRRASAGWHVACAAASLTASPWWLLGFGPAAIRALVLRPGMRARAIGAVEAGVAVLMVVAAFLALPSG